MRITTRWWETEGLLGSFPGTSRLALVRTKESFTSCRKPAQRSRWVPHHLPGTPYLARRWPPSGRCSAGSGRYWECRRRIPEAGLLYHMVKIVLVPVVRVFVRPQVEGLENVPEQGPAILAGNHVSALDPLLLGVIVPRRVTFLAKADFFTRPGVSGRLIAAFFKGLGQVPVDRSGGGAGDAALSTGLRVLNEGALLGIYPEGAVSPDGKLHRGKTGVARLALESKVPVIPVAITGIGGRLANRTRPQPRSAEKSRVSVRFGTPLDFSAYQDDEEDQNVLRFVTEALMKEIGTLSGQEYIDTCAIQRRREFMAEIGG
jgi:1-acyl-sn-glycerol-3-phosphate acyltransferase